MTTEFCAYRRATERTAAGFYYALSFPGQCVTVWAHLIPVEGGWTAHGVGDEDLGKCLRSRLAAVGAGDVRAALAACRTGYADFYHPEPEAADEDAAYDRWVANMGDPSPSAQQFEADVGRYL